jgi:phosphoribosylanthranilate isomerase
VPPFIKICGIQTIDEGRLALDCGATALGFLVGLTHRAEDGIDAATAAAIIACLPSAREMVLVTHLLQPQAVTQLAEQIGVNVIQVHDRMAVPDVLLLRAINPSRRIAKAVHVTGDAALDEARAYAAAADALLLDSRTSDRLGGTGCTHDWTISRKIVAAVAPVPVYLAGGLTPDNVSAAVQAVRPAGVDVNSGVEDGVGRKDRQKLTAFVAAARTALASQASKGRSTPP